ncbi:2-hydroxyacid dehydrogenase [Acidisoma silvae]|uniref:2-hydroxyacid dehydrogenase n=1 Tax=Acidisoma silvae TaxID=2802396 RepID=A0A963YWA5_9PROT|nr:2-hydroxyacid dehydrogenase [Acidisoma silvae]MCB8878050.1 2-hydroxyacid dehydrogenase [Acidisoma silvae]
MQLDGGRQYFATDKFSNLPANVKNHELFCGFLMTEHSKTIAILVPGPLNEQALSRIDTQFTLVKTQDLVTSVVPRDLAQRIRGIAAIIPVNAAMMDAFPSLEIIAHFGVGYDSVDVRHAAEAGIMVTNTPGVLTEDVADLALGLLLNAIRELPRAENWLRSGHWVAKGPYPLTKMTLRGRRVGIFGLGRVGLAVAHRVEALGLPVSYCNRNAVPDAPYPYYTNLLELAENVDTLISVVPGGVATAKAINADVLRALGPNGVFINIGRGSSVDQEALIEALKSGIIAAAGLDVYADEPNVPQALIDLPNVTLLPHVGSATEYTRGAMADLCVDNLISWFSSGRPITAVPETAHVLPR